VYIIAFYYARRRATKLQFEYTILAIHYQAQYHQIVGVTENKVGGWPNHANAGMGSAGAVAPVSQFSSSIEASLDL
jgi:hypothetical protein